MFALLWNFDMATSGPGGRYAWTNGPGFGCALLFTCCFHYMHRVRASPPSRTNIRLTRPSMRVAPTCRAHIPRPPQSSARASIAREADAGGTTFHPPPPPPHSCIRHRRRHRPPRPLHLRMLRRERRLLRRRRQSFCSFLNLVHARVAFMHACEHLAPAVALRRSAHPNTK